MIRMIKIALIVGILLILLAVPLTVFLVMQQQDIRQRAAPATTLTLSPPTLTVSVNQTFSLDVMIDKETGVVRVYDGTQRMFKEPRASDFVAVNE